MIELRRVANRNKTQNGYGLFDVWVTGMKLRWNVGELLNEGNGSVNMVEKM